MNTYKFEELRIGQTESFEYKITSEKMNILRELSGDCNPLHNDELFAQKYGYDGRVVYGMLSALFISTLGGIYLPGKYCIIQQIDCKFVSPVYVGDIITVKGSIKELNESVRQAVIKVEMKNQAEKKVVRAILKVGFLE